MPLLVAHQVAIRLCREQEGLDQRQVGAAAYARAGHRRRKQQHDDQSDHQEMEGGAAHSEAHEAQCDERAFASMQLAR